MKRILCFVLCLSFVLPVLLVPASAAGVDNDLSNPRVVYGLYGEYFIYLGQTYEYQNNLAAPNDFLPGFMYVDSNQVLIFFYSVPDFSSLSIGISSAGSFVFNSPPEVYAERFFYADDEFNLISAGSVFDFNGSWDFGVSNYSDFQNRIVCSLIDVKWDPSIRDGIFISAKNSVLDQPDPVDPFSQDSFFYLNDGSWVDPDLPNNQAFFGSYSLGFNLESATLLKPNPMLFMFKSGPSSISVAWIDYNDNAFIAGVRCYLMMSSAGEYYIRCTLNDSAFADFYISNFDLTFNDDGSISSVTRRDFGKVGSWDCYCDFSFTGDPSSVPALQNILLCSSVPIYWAKASDTIFFWENPRGRNADPNYIIIPPLDILLPEIQQGELKLAADSYYNFKESFSVVSGKSHSFLQSISGSIMFAGSMLSNLVTLPYIDGFVHVSLALGIVGFAFGLFSIVISRGGGRGKSDY